MLLLVACSAGPSGTDAGPVDSGVPDAGPGVRQACVASTCELKSGVWQVIFTGVSANPLCRPVDEQVELTSSGSTLCMLKAVDGGSDGGCGFEFYFRSGNDAGLVIDDAWRLYRPDAGHIYGTWTTVVSGSASCTATYMLHAVD